MSLFEEAMAMNEVDGSVLIVTEIVVLLFDGE